MEAPPTPEATLALYGARVSQPRGTSPQEQDEAPAFDLKPGLAPVGYAIPHRAWVGGPGWLIPGALNVASGAPGSMKSTLMGHFAVALAAGEPWAGLEPERPYRVLIAHWEDDTHEVWRRLQAAAGAIAPGAAELIRRNIALLHMADHGPLVQQAGVMEPRSTPTLAMLEAAAAAHGAEVLILDPLAEAVAVQENDNAIMRLGLAPLRRLAQRRKAAVVAVHHDRKGADGTALDRMRGGSALSGLIRRHLPVRQMTAEQARQFQVPEDTADGYICLERGKTQYARQRGPVWFRVTSHTLPNGDDAAALELWAPPAITIGPEHLTLALNKAREGISGRPLALGNLSPDYFVTAFAQAGVPRPLAKAALAQLNAEGKLNVRGWRNPATRKPGDRLWAEGNQHKGWVEGGAP